MVFTGELDLAHLLYTHSLTHRPMQDYISQWGFKRCLGYICPGACKCTHTHGHTYIPRQNTGRGVSIVGLCMCGGGHTRIAEVGGCFSPHVFKLREIRVWEWSLNTTTPSRTQIALLPICYLKGMSGDLLSYTVMWSDESGHDPQFDLLIRVMCIWQNTNPVLNSSLTQRGGSSRHEL